MVSGIGPAVGAFIELFAGKNVRKMDVKLARPSHGHPESSQHGEGHVEAAELAALLKAGA